MILKLSFKNGPMLVLYVRSQSKLSADTFLNPAVGVAEGSLAGETALKRCHDRRGHCGQRSRRSSIAECLHLAYQDNTNRKFFSYHLPSDESIRGETDLGLVNTVLACPLRAEVLDVLATRFHAAYLCATRECRDGSEECPWLNRASIRPFPRTASERRFCGFICYGRTARSRVQRNNGAE